MVNGSHTGEPQNTDLGTKIFNRKPFPWTDAQRFALDNNGNTERRRFKKPESGPIHVAYEVVVPDAVVRAEPQKGAKMLAKKTQGSRLLIAELTVDGWARLVDNQGWLLTHHRGVNGVNEAVLPVHDFDFILAVPEHHPQGVACFHVKKPDVLVRERPSLESGAVRTELVVGSFVFGEAQDFDGWIRLCHSDGWVKTRDEKGTRLLWLRSSGCACLHMLAAVWSWAWRRGRLTPEVSDALQGAELEALLCTNDALVMHWAEDSLADLVAQGRLEAEELQAPEIRVRQRLFARHFCELLRSTAGLAEIFEHFELPAVGAALDASDRELAREAHAAVLDLKWRLSQLSKVPRPIPKGKPWPYKGDELQVQQ